MAKRVDLVYGSSGSGKTTWALRLAEYIFATSGKTTRWLLGDGGGETIHVSGATSGTNPFVEVINYPDFDNPLETTQLLCEGYIPGPQGKLVPSSDAELDAIGLWVIEGLTVMSDYIMGDKVGGLANRMSRGDMLNNDDSYRLTDGTLKFGGNARTHFGFTQRRILDLIQRTRALPGTVLWTGHERRVEDEENRETLFGPDVCGRALTARIGASFGNTVHLQKVTTKVKAVDPTTKKPIEKLVLERRAYTQEHVDPEAKTFVKYYANCRVPAGVREAYPDIMPDYFNPPDPIAFYAALQSAEERDILLREQRSKDAMARPPIRLL